MSQTITNFKSGFNGGTRANRFNVSIAWPSGTSSLAPGTLNYHVIATKLPEAELGSISIPYRGRVAHFAGDREYKPWTITVLDDTGSNASWLAFQTWANLISNHASNTVIDQTYSAGTSTNSLLKTLTFNQLHDPTDPTGVGHLVERTITLKHAWPSEVGQIGLDMGEGGNLISYSVTFSYDYYVITTGIGQ